MKAAFVDFRRGISSYGFIVSILLVFIALIVEYNSGTHSYMLNSGFRAAFGSSYLYVIAIAATLPFNGIIQAEKNSGFLKFSVLRIGTRKYIFRKIIGCALSSGLAIFVGVVLFGVYYYFLGGGINAAPDFVDPRDPAWQVFCYENFSVGVVFTALSAGFFGIVWSVCALAYSSIVSGRFLGLVLPFMTFYAFIYLVMETWTIALRYNFNGANITRFFATYVAEVPQYYSLPDFFIKIGVGCIYLTIFIIFFVKGARRCIYDH